MLQTPCLPCVWTEFYSANLFAVQFPHGCLPKSACNVLQKAQRGYLRQSIKDGVQGVAQHMRSVAFGWAGIVQHLDCIVQVLCA